MSFHYKSIDTLQHYNDMKKLLFFKVLRSLQRYTYRVLQTIQMKLILLCVWEGPVVLGCTNTALTF